MVATATRAGLALKGSVPPYRQRTSDYSCGPVCICSCLDYLLMRDDRPKLDYAAIRKIEDLTMEGRVWSSWGTGYDRMKSAVRSMGFGCREIRGSTDKARKNDLQQSIARSNPVILSCVAGIGRKRYRHYVVLIGIDDSHIRVHDPYPKGRPSRIRFEDFLKNGRRTSWGNRRWGIEVYTKN